MKTTIVPAQIMDVEDRVAGRLSFKQLILLMAPVFMGLAIFAALPEFLVMNTYKIWLISIITLICLVSALRLKDKLVIEWLVTMINFHKRPQYFVYDKNTLFQRPVLRIDKTKSVESVTPARPTSRLVKPNSPLDSTRDDQLTQLVTSSALAFKAIRSPKGDLRVHIRKNT